MPGKPRLPDPLSEIAQSIVDLLKTHRSGQNSAGPLLTWSQIVASLSGVAMEWASAALLKSPARGQVIVAVPDDLKSPVALIEDLKRLVSDPVVLHRLIQHPQHGCSAANPVRSLTEVCRSADKSLRRDLEEYWGSDQARLPEGISRIHGGTGKKKSTNLHDERFARPEVLLAGRLLDALKQLKSAGVSRYPASFADLVKRAEILQTDPLLPEALALPDFTAAAMLVAGQLPDGWLCLRSDAENVVRTEGFLKRLLHAGCSESHPEQKLSFVARLIVKDLQSSFMEVWRTHFDLQRKFEFMEMTAIGSRERVDLILRDARFPRPEKVLSEQLVRTLERRRSDQSGAEPLTWTQLAEQTRSGADAALLQKALIAEPFCSRVLVALPCQSESPVALNEDLDRLASSAGLLDAVLSQLISDDTSAVPLEKLTGLRTLHSSVRAAFETSLKTHLETKQLPPGFGAVRQAGKWLLFRLQDAMWNPAVLRDAISGAAGRNRSKRSSSVVGESAAQPMRESA
jgi:hypothetical protein